MHPRVSQLYLEFMLLAPSFVTKSAGATSALPVASASSSAQAPTAVRLSDAALSTASYRAMIQKGFMEGPHVEPGAVEFKRRLARGRWLLRQLQDMIELKRYRAMHKRYGWSSLKSEGELIELHGEDMAKVMMMGLGNKDVYGYDNTEEEEHDTDDKSSNKKK